MESKQFAVISDVANSKPALKPQSSSRFVFVGNAYFQSVDESPQVVELQLSEELASSEQPWSRKLKVGPDWKALDFGWLDGQVGFLVLQNEEGKRFQTIPTRSERAETMARIVEVKFEANGVTAAVLVRPGRFLACEPEGASRVYVRCRSGEARCTLTAYPG